VIEERTGEMIDEVVMAHLQEGTTVVSDEWPAHKGMKKRLEERHGWIVGDHHMLKHKEEFSKKVKLPNGTVIMIHTKKQEGVDAHMKKQMKAMLGSSVGHVEGYLAAACFKLNCTARLRNPFDAFLDELKVL
jgi:hypothetical protein